MTKNDFIRELAFMVIVSNEAQRPEMGYHLSKYWLTPSRCYELAKLIEEVNNEDLGVGNWSFHKEAIERLMKGTDPA